MSQETHHKIKLGIFVMLGLIFLIVALYLIGNQRNMFNTRFQLSTRFADVNGLREGNSVRFAGIDVGIVKRITIVSDSAIQVDMLVREGVRNYIKKNAVATIGTDGLVGNVIINIRPGTGNALPVEINDWIVSQSNIDTDALLRTLSISNENVATLTQNLVTMTNHINKGEGTVGMLIHDKPFALSLQQTLHNLSQASEGAAATINELKSTAVKINRGSGIIGFLAEDTLTVWQLQHTIRKLQASSEAIAEVAQNINLMVKGIEAGKGTAGLLISDSTMANEMQTSLDEIHTGIGLFNENMEALQHSVLLRRYFKKQERLKP
ncbi:phospholipid/cholesterol/gamma-HCH transport system substrate-binding protein [Catalinimonas alkaloidigena]|uniref:MlaD family protein n=1 Tax=Catalinimonas alkaloidigena TaxID=1075417 RepID=UPI0024073C06|nr:MlaD family protein [Catalinimonas alkaloidigena]MDF9797874.1 phospholipid/cholesterol/gamma-HCH transport system substrate-binding protein [Catalinimonas alkaloidigena]